jgi:hypothetical protein
MDVRSTNGLAIRCHTLVGIPCFIDDQASHFVGEIFQISKAIKFHLGAPPVSSMNFDVVPTAIDRMGSKNEACLAKGWEVVFVKVATDLVFCKALGIEVKGKKSNPVSCTPSRITVYCNTPANLHAPKTQHTTLHQRSCLATTVL